MFFFLVDFAVQNQWPGFCVIGNIEKKLVKESCACKKKRRNCGWKITPPHFILIHLFSYLYFSFLAEGRLPLLVEQRCGVWESFYVSFSGGLLLEYLIFHYFIDFNRILRKMGTLGEGL